MLQIPEPDFTAILSVLVGQGVDFIVVGGVCAVLNGAPVNTFDLDVVHSREANNIGRLLAALDVLDAFYRVHPERRLKPGISHLISPGHQNLETCFGPLDLLGTIGHGLGYAELLDHSVEMEVAQGVRVRVLGLAKLIEVKEQLGGDKDKAVLPILKRALEESTGR